MSLKSCKEREEKRLKHGQATDIINEKTEKKKPMHTILKSFLPSSVIVS